MVEKIPENHHRMESSSTGEPTPFDDPPTGLELQCWQAHPPDVRPVYLWVDDVRPAEGEDPAYQTWVARTALAALHALLTGRVRRISLDHDLGDGPTGLDLARVLKALVAGRFIGRPHWVVHSMHPMGAQAIHRVLEEMDGVAGA